jgi:hypothetical protein
MLPAQREIKNDKSEVVRGGDPVLLSAGKTVDSVDGLRQRLQDIDLDQITSVVERLTDLREPLVTLQRALGIVTEVSACEPRVRRAQDEVTQDLNRINAEILEALSLLRRAVDTDPVIDIRDLQNHSVNAPADPVPADPKSVVLFDTQSLDSEVPSKIEADQTVLPTQEQEYAEALTLTDKFIPDDPEPNGVADFAAPRGESFIGTAVGSVSEWLDDNFLEEAKSSDRAFELTDDVLEDAGTDTVEKARESFSPQVTHGNHHDAAPNLAAATADFDQKLLDDLIKNYGEFAIYPALPTTVEPLNPPKKVETPSASRAMSRQDSAIARPVFSYQNHGEFDAKLKKLIKEYGQVDLYSQHSSIKTKLRAVGAFAVLGAVLSGIYYFFSPKPDVDPNPSAQSRPSEGSDQAGSDLQGSVDGLR